MAENTNGNGLGGWVREWYRPALLIVVLSIIFSAIGAWATLGNDVGNNSASITRLEVALDKALPREVAEERFKSIDEDLDDIKGLLRAK